MSSLKQKYDEEVRQALIERFSYKNVMQVPRLEKVVINMGIGEGKDNPKLLDAAAADLASITGQKPVITKAKNSIASFKLREGMSIGCKVTLRGERMYDFVSKLINVALPCMISVEYLQSHLTEEVIIL